MLNSKNLKTKKISRLKIFSWDEVLSGKVLRFLGEKKSSLAIGSFDGPHIGHKAIFARLVENANQKNQKSGVVTFSKPLAGLKHSKEYLGDISSLEEKLLKIEKYKIDFAVVIDFTAEFGALDGIEFLKILCEKCSLGFLAEGEDFHFGYGGKCKNHDINEFLKVEREKSCAKKFLFDFEIVPPIVFCGERVSSSAIRKCLKNGEIEKAKKMLGE